MAVRAVPAQRLRPAFVDIFECLQRVASDDPHDASAVFRTRCAVANNAINTSIVLALQVSIMPSLAQRVAYRFKYTHQNRFIAGGDIGDDDAAPQARFACMGHPFRSLLQRGFQAAGTHLDCSHISEGRACGRQCDAPHEVNPGNPQGARP
jgi:hypothetical protein